jgi:NDP-sugar pyrophosphorylase family protein
MMNNHQKPTLVVLAAGMGSRFGGLKQVEGVGPHGEAIIDYSVYDAIRAGFGKVVFVIRHDIREAFVAKVSRRWEGKVPIVLAYQEPELGVPAGLPDMPPREKPWGTAHAVLAAAAEVHEPFAVINADDYYGIDGFSQMSHFLTHTCQSSHFAMVGYVLARTLSEHGAVSRGVCEVNADGRLSTVTERHRIRRERSHIVYAGDHDEAVSLPQNTLVSMNFWGFHPSVFSTLQCDFEQYVRTNYQNPKGEFYIPTVVNRMIREEQLRLSVLPSQDQWHGVTYREDKPKVEEVFTALVGQGLYPSPIWS